MIPHRRTVPYFNSRIPLPFHKQSRDAWAWKIKWRLSRQWHQSRSQWKGICHTWAMNTGAVSCETRGNKSWSSSSGPKRICPLFSNLRRGQAMTMTVRMLSAGATTILIAKPFLSREVAVMQAYWPKRTRVPSSSLKRSTRNKEKVQSKVGSAC